VANNTGLPRHTVPLGVWFRTALILALVLAATTVYDNYYRDTNPYIRAAGEKIARFERNPDKPLVVAIGASLLMQATPRDWHGNDFDWLRLIIQGSRLGDFAAVTDEVIALKPALVVIGLHQFVHIPYDVKLRRAFKRLLRVPLEAAGLIAPSKMAHFEMDGCGGGMQLDAALEHVEEQFSSPGHGIPSSAVLESFMQHNIPVLIVRVPMLEAIESGVAQRRAWLQTVQRDAASLGLEIDDPGWRNLDEKYFCPDHIHMDDTGKKRFSAWLAPEIRARLVASE
jgi:hypothetical protein